jgi:hypothetical protein
MAQAVSSRFLTAAARFRAQFRSCGICGGQSGTGAGFLRVLRFPLPILIPPTAPHSSSIIGAGTTGQLATDVPNGLSLTPPQEKNYLLSYCLLGCDALVRQKLTFRRNVVYSIAYMLNKQLIRSKMETHSSQLTFSLRLLGLLFDTEDAGITFLRNVSKSLSDYTASHPRRV